MIIFLCQAMLSVSGNPDQFIDVALQCIIMNNNINNINNISARLLSTRSIVETRELAVNCEAIILIVKMIMNIM